MTSENDKNDQHDEEPSLLNLSDITEEEKNLIQRDNYNGSSDEEYEDEDDAEALIEPSETAMTTEALEKALAQIDDPLNNRLSPKRRSSLKKAINHKKNPVQCPWYPSLTMYEWITLIMGMFELQYIYFEDNVTAFVHNPTFIGMNGHMRRKIKAEIKNLAILCFATAVQGYACSPNGNAMLMRGGTQTVATNNKFYDTYENIQIEDWEKTIINPVAKWMANTFMSRTVKKLHTNAPARKRKLSNSDGKPAQDSESVATSYWFTEHNLTTTKGGECALSYLSDRFVPITKTCNHRTKIVFSKACFYTTALIVVRLGVDTSNWQFSSDQMLKEECDAWKELKQLAWTSEQAVTRSVNRFKQADIKYNAWCSDTVLRKRAGTLTLASTSTQLASTQNQKNDKNNKE